MPLYDPDHVEYQTVNGHIQIVMDDGERLPAYWSHPEIGDVFPGVVLIHDWWGITPIVRRMAHLFAQVGHYVIVPDLFEGRVATDPREALALVEALGDTGYKCIDAALDVLEHHHQCNGSVAAVGIGMGGTLTYEAAIVRSDLEAAISYYGFPQRGMGRFKDAPTPILAFYGSEKSLIDAKLVEQLRQELANSPLKGEHQVEILAGAVHGFIEDNLPEQQRDYGKRAWNHTLAFLEAHLEGPTQPPQKRY